MKNKIALRWITLIIIGTLSFLTLFMIKSNYTSVEKNGRQLLWPVRIASYYHFSDNNKTDVIFLATTANWVSKEKPKFDEKVYISLNESKKGVVIIKDARNTIPVKSLYITAKVIDISTIDDKTQIEFEIPANTVYINPNDINKDFFNDKFKGTLMAKLKIKDGLVVVADVLYNNISITKAIPDLKAKPLPAYELIHPKVPKEKSANTKTDNKETKVKKDKKDVHDV